MAQVQIARYLYIFSENDLKNVCMWKKRLGREIEEVLFLRKYLEGWLRQFLVRFVLCVMTSFVGQQFALASLLLQTNLFFISQLRNGEENDCISIRLLCIGLNLF